MRKWKIIYLEKFAKKHEDRPIYQPELFTYTFYENKEIIITDFYIFILQINLLKKIIKNNIYVKALNSLNNFYINMYRTQMEDQIMNFMIYIEYLIHFII